MMSRAINPSRGEPTHQEVEYVRLAQDIKDWGRELGFRAVAITGIDLGGDEEHFLQWVERGFHGEMAYMERHGTKRSRPADLMPGVMRVISLCLDYWPPHSAMPRDVLNNPELGYISRYALGRDYHKVLRQRLKKLAGQIQARIGDFGHRVFVDSAPVLEKALARDAGLGWIGKHTNLIHPRRGSWFFLGEIYTDLPLPVDPPYPTHHCGRCTACIDVCPTGAIIAPYQLDARRCISYLTIELRGPIPETFRPLIGNRIYGCDDCQLVCPWNRFARTSAERDFVPRFGLDAPRLVELFSWSEEEFMKRTEGSAIRRIGYECWLRNIAVALGNAPASLEIVTALEKRRSHPASLVREHVVWALNQQALRKKLGLGANPPQGQRAGVVS